MSKISISLFLHIVFAVAFALLFATFLLFLQYDKNNFQTQLQNRYQLIANGFLSSMQFMQNQRDFQNLYEHFQVKEVNDWGLQIKILNDSNIVFFKERYDSRIRVFHYNDEYYIYIQKLGHNLMLQDMRAKSYNQFIATALFAILFLVFLMLYIFIRKKILPLKILNEKIQRFGNGETDVDLIIQGNDEIATISKSFDDAVKNINRLMESKNLFMQNFMHELKTPIAKGKITTALLPDSKDKELLDKIFDRMDKLVKEIARIEKSKIALLKRKKIPVSKLFSNAKLMLLEGCEICSDIDDFDLFVDEEMLTIVLKNLLENSCKYGEGEVTFIAKNKTIKVCNPGPKLEKPLHYYLEAFIKDRDSKGLGLGLYLCQTILKQHKSTLHYSHSYGKNCFWFEL